MRVRLAPAVLSVALLLACETSPERGASPQHTLHDAEAAAPATELDAERPANDMDAAADATASKAETETGALVESDASVAKDAGHARALGMNDVTILTPVPANPANSPVLMLGSDPTDDGRAMVPRALFDRLAGPFAGDMVKAVRAEGYEALHLVAVRLDLCERAQPGPCGPTEDGRLRLVFQQFLGFSSTGNTPAFFDTSFHALYTIPNAELAASVAELRALAAIQDAPVEGPLRPSPALSDVSKPVYAQYAAAARRFVKARALEARLAQLTLNTQPQEYAQVRWLFRGLARAGDGSFQELPIAGSSASTLHVFLAGNGYDVRDAGVAPEGLNDLLSYKAYGEAEPPRQLSAVATMLAVDNPLRHGTATASCVACHTATALREIRAATIDLKNFPEGYKSTRDLSVDAGVLPDSLGTLRALGFAGWDAKVVISRRVVNETAQVLDEIALRYP